MRTINRQGPEGLHIQRHAELSGDIWGEGLLRQLPDQLALGIPEQVCNFIVLLGVQLIRFKLLRGSME
ncbi:hypothetical protein D3C81_1889170 [compost metagenome]